MERDAPYFITMPFTSEHQIDFAPTKATKISKTLSKLQTPKSVRCTEADLKASDNKT